MTFSRPIHFPTLALTGGLLLAGLLAPLQQARATWPQSVSNGNVTRTLSAANGDLFIAGHFSGETRLGNFTLNAVGLQDVFVARLDAAGRVLWASSAGGQSVDTVEGMALDASNNVYIAGSFYNTIGVGGTNITSRGGRDGFVARLNAQGQWGWAQGIGGTGADDAADLVVLPGDSTQVPPIPDALIVTGSYANSATFGSGSGSLTVTPSVTGRISDVFLAKLTVDGTTWNWAVRSTGSTGTDKGVRLALDSQNRLHLVGKTSAQQYLVNDTFPVNGDLANNWNIQSSGGVAHSISGDHLGRLQQIGIGNQAVPGLAMRSGAVSLTHKNTYHPGPGPMQLQFQLYRGKQDPNLRMYQWWIPLPRTPFSSGGFSYNVASEKPDGGEDLVFEFLAQNGQWYELQRFSGSGTEGGQYLNLTAGQSVWVDRTDMRHPGLKFRLRMTGGSGQYSGSMSGIAYTEHYDWWHVAHVSVRHYATHGFIQPVSNLRASAPSFGNIKLLPVGAEAKDVDVQTLDGVTRIYLVGKYTNGFTLPQSSCSLSGSGGFVVSLKFGAEYECGWLRYAGNSEVNSVSAASGRVYVAGGFSGTANFAVSPTAPPSTTLVGNPGGDDVFVAALLEQPSGGIWEWATGGSQNLDNPPAAAGGMGDDRALAITAAAGGQLYVGGSFQGVAQFGPVEVLAAQANVDGFLIKIGSDGRFFQPETWPVGVALTPPSGADVSSSSMQPDIYMDGQLIREATGNDYRWFTWVYEPSKKGRLIPLQPTPMLEVHWRVQGEPMESSARLVTQGAAVWPSTACGENDIPGDNTPQGCYQVHVVGAPVEAVPNAYQIFGDVINPSSGSSGATLDGGVFNATRSGHASIVYVRGPSVDQSQYPTYVEVVRSLPYAMTPGFEDNVQVEIGKKVTHVAHNEPNRAGWIVNELAYYDGHGNNAAYNRAARTGTIIPVNRNSIRRTQDFGREMAVAWYRRNAKGVYWASQAVRYQPRWPLNPDRIVIASELGSEVFGQQILSASQFPQAHIYVQNNFNAPGFNPNDEHAMMAPSANGSGVDAVFALRSDFGGQDDQAAPSDPYVLLKYFNNSSLEWNYRIYRVLATGASYNRFRYTGTAGTTVSPPYPVRLLPGCSNTFVAGQAAGEPPPAPFFQDHKNQIWAKSAGNGTVHYFYPMQPGFYQDDDNNDVNDYATGECTPWLARLSESQGGAGASNTPIPVEYTIQWPETTPLLIAGETLLTPKRGLPDIYNQAAVEIVYDDNRDNTPNAGPADTLAQLIDPLSSRWVRLAQFPESVAREMRTDGFFDITGSSDGVLKMPASLGERMYYDGMNQRLVFQGVFDETGAGDPRLLLNVLSKRDRIALKKLNGGDGSEESDSEIDCVATAGCNWDQAIEALYRLTRNPARIEAICRDATINDNRERVCNDLDEDLSPDELLIAYEDPAGNGMLQPLSVVGSGAALTAGAATGSGYMTIAFNNDPSLGALPVSLEVIRVGCLESDATNPPIFAPYQGQINVISPDNIFDEQLVLRHGGDFGGNPDALQFEWYFRPDANGTPPMPLPSPETGQMHGWVQFPVADPNGAVEISIEGANIQTLSDNWYLTRYRGLSACSNESNWSLWAGQPGSTPLAPRAQLAEGWVKRVLGRLNPFEARVQDFGESETNNYVSMLIQLGERYSGPVALNNDADNLNSMGLIEAYTTVMRRALQLSADSTPPIDYGPANAAVLLVASRLVDFYTLLGNEAYADAQDPTIGIETTGGEYMSLAPSIFNFQNQLESPLVEELVLLRGRDDAHGPVAASPVYNRLFWNFTTGDGEVAYAISYNIADQDVNGVINEYDARIQFPQGHGDAWGHYLTAMKTYYGLLKHPFFSWNPQSEAVLVAGVPINVDFLDERQFAETAAAKARAGAEIVDLTYRTAYVEDPAGQWQGYEDTNAERAWGLSEWGRRAGMGAYFDWVTGNAILPVEDDNPAHVGIQRIERNNITDLQEVHAHYAAIQGQVDKADAGLNPLGLAKGVVSFDIDPNQLTWYNKTQFEQVWERAMAALSNAVKLWDYANKLNNQLRRSQDSADDVWDASIDEETSFTNQLIEIFGYPYIDDIGPGGTYPDGYNGPDIYHYMYMDKPALSGTPFDFDGGLGDAPEVRRVMTKTGHYRPAANGVGFFNFTPSETLGGNLTNLNCSATNALNAGCPLGDTPDQTLEVKYVLSESSLTGYAFIKPEEWSGQRRAPGRLQQVQQEMLMAQIALKQATLEYDKMRLDVEAATNLMRATFDVSADNINIAVNQRDDLKRMTMQVEVMRSVSIVARRVGDQISEAAKEGAECIPDDTIAGLAFGGDLFSLPKCGLRLGGWIASTVGNSVADALDIAANAVDAAKEDVSELAGIKSAINDANLELYSLGGEVDALLREEPMLRSEIFAQMQAIAQLQGEYNATLAEGQRVYEQLLVFRRSGAAETQESRYRDMAFRIFRNDALAKYRAAFDLAARYVYLATTAYDYETNLLGGDAKAGRRFLSDIVKERSLGQVIDGVPMTGSPGLANSMAQLKLNFDVLKGQMGFNTPQVETNRFSLRRELFRIPAGEEGDAQWRRTLEAARVPDLWQVPEFRRYARPFAPESAGAQPGLVFEFSTNVSFALNFFGWDLGPQDSSYNSSRFATRIRSVGAWFGNYADLPLADDPNLYLIPVGADVLRAPDPLDFTVREWQVMDQVIPVPFPVGTQEMQAYDWIPSRTLDGAVTDIRRYPMMRAYHFAEPFDEAQVTSDSRLIGRSVWNRKWLLIIPGGTFLADPNEGLDTFIHGARVPGGGSERDGHGVDDIRIFFKTYSYSGN
ncbi:hypothetical protein OS176_04370 [Xanthomonadaceae bacterium XH05]|nr:hypothetical protein [Xanthomonadaceae bacterium XH05]